MHFFSIKTLNYNCKNACTINVRFQKSNKSLEAIVSIKAHLLVSPISH